jgi:photosystem II stability/assembly factor-like uncharacterized protein
VYALAINPQDASTLYAGTSAGVFKSTDGGASWNASRNGLPAYFPVFALAINPQSPSTLYAGIYGGGVFESLDSSASWSAANNGLASRSAIEHGMANTLVMALAINPQNPSTLYAATRGGGVFESLDGGVSWSAINNGLPPNLWVSALAINPQTPSTLYAATIGDGVFESLDGGVSWSSARWGATNDSMLDTLRAIVLTLAINPQTPSTLYAATYAGVFESTDGGASWHLALNGLPNTMVMALAINPQNPSTLYAGTKRSGVFESTDGGASWTTVNNGLAANPPEVHALAINPQNPSTLYAGTTSGVFLLASHGN